MFYRILMCIFMIAIYRIGVFPLVLSDSAEERYPIYAPERCQENELLYPLKQKDWTCDCRPGYIYYHETQTCYAAYRQGPCKNGEYIILEKKSSKCKKNPCEADGIVKYNNGCYALDKPGGPCQPKSSGAVVGVLSVQEVTFTLKCLNQNETLALVKIPKTTPCSPGTKLTYSNDCRRAISDDED